MPDRRTLVKWFGLLSLLLLGVYVLAVNILPIVTNDSLEYIAHSRSPGEYGVVFIGYRQIGYPVSLLIDRGVADLVGVEPLLFTAIVQRLLLIGSLVYAIWLWRWRAVPVALLVAAPSLLAYPNFILTEGLTVPLGLFLACVVGHYFRIDEGGSEADNSDVKGTLLAASLVAVVCLVMVVVRYPLAVFGAIPVVIVAAAIFGRRDHWRSLAAIALGFVASVGLFSYALASENSSEYGSFSPSTRSERAQYWGVWHVTFTLNPMNQEKAGLADYYSGGTPYRHIDAVDMSSDVYAVQAATYEEDMADIFDLAGLNVWRERLFSFFGALRGGRIDDLEKHIIPTLESDARSVDAAIYRNTLAASEGPEAFDSGFNEGHRPQAVVTSPAFPDSPVPYVQDVLNFLLPLAIMGTLFLTVRNRQWWLGLAYLIPVFALSAAMGWILMDNVRFLLPASMFGVAGFSALWSSSRLPERS